MNMNISLREYVEFLENKFSKKFIDNYKFLNDLDNLDNVDELLESHGAYDGQVNLVYLLSKIVTSEIFKKRLKERYEFSKEDILKYAKNHDIEFKNIFFKKIIITISHNSTGYVSKDNFDDGHIKEVIININKDEKMSFKDLCIIFYHELLHAYESWKRFISNSESMNDVRDRINYDKLILIFKKSNTDTIEDIIENVVKYLLYMYSSIEKNAFMTEIHAILLSYKHKGLSKLIEYKDAIKEFKTSQEWVAIEKGIEFINTDDKEIKDIFISKYLQITNQNLSYSKAIKKITNIVFKCKDKFEELAPKVYFDYYETFIKENSNIIGEDFLMTKNKNRIFISLSKLINENFKELGLCQ